MIVSSQKSNHQQNTTSILIIAFMNIAVDSIPVSHSKKN